VAQGTGPRRSVVAKVRVYELAKEFGVESKAVMDQLKEMGEFVRSASSTIEAPVVRRLKEAFAGSAAVQDKARSGASGPRAGAPAGGDGARAQAGPGPRAGTAPRGGSPANATGAAVPGSPKKEKK